jgi:hypothetical protein
MSRAFGFIELILDQQHHVVLANRPDAFAELRDDAEGRQKPLLRHRVVVAPGAMLGYDHERIVCQRSTRVRLHRIYGEHSTIILSLL